MANRHLSRSVVLQTLFERDFRSLPREDTNASLTRIAAEFAPAAGDMPFMEELLLGVIDRETDLNLIIGKAAPEWPLDRISPVDRNILRLGLYELLFADRSKVPAKVAINEAIELGKAFGGENSGRFVNGVLGAVYKELGEPGKDEGGKKRKDIPYDQMPVERLGGAVVFARHEGDIYLALVHDIFGHWTLSKGKIGDNPEIANETVEEGTIREIKEEIGLTIKLLASLGDNEYVASDPKVGKKRKHVSYFLAQSPYEDVQLQEEKGGLDDARWFKLKDALDLNFYEDILPIVTKGVQQLSSTAVDEPEMDDGETKHHRRR